MARRKSGALFLCLMPARPGQGLFVVYGRYKPYCYYLRIVAEIIGLQTEKSPFHRIRDASAVRQL